MKYKSASSESAGPLASSTTDGVHNFCLLYHAGLDVVQTMHGCLTAVRVIVMYYFNDMIYVINCFQKADRMIRDALKGKGPQKGFRSG